MIIYCRFCSLLDRILYKIFALLGYYAASSGNPLPTFRDNLSVLSSRLKQASYTYWPLKMGPIGFPETSVKDYNSTLRNIPEEWRSHQHRGGNLNARNVHYVMHELPLYKLRSNCYIFKCSLFIVYRSGCHVMTDNVYFYNNYIGRDRDRTRNPNVRAFVFVIWRNRVFIWFPQ